MNAAIQSRPSRTGSVHASSPKQPEARPDIDLRNAALPRENVFRQGAPQAAIAAEASPELNAAQCESMAAQDWKRLSKTERWRKITAGVRLVAVEGALFGLASALLPSNVSLLPMAGAIIAAYPLLNSVANNRTEQRRAEELQGLASALDGKTPGHSLMILKQIQPADYELLLRGCSEGINASFSGTYNRREYRIVSAKQCLTMLEKFAEGSWAAKERLLKLGGFVPSPAWLKERLTALLRSGELSGGTYKKACHLIGHCKQTAAR